MLANDQRGKELFYIFFFWGVFANVVLGAVRRDRNDNMWVFVAFVTAAFALRLIF